MTEKDFQRQQEPLLDAINRANVPIEKRQAAHLALNNLWQLRIKHEMWNTTAEEKPERKPRKKMTTVEKFDKKNSRREAIMAQKERHGTRG